MIRRCIGCGCTDLHPCITLGGMACRWVAADLCSACVDEEELAQLEPYVDGHTYDPESGLYLR